MMVPLVRFLKEYGYSSSLRKGEQWRQVTTNIYVFKQRASHRIRPNPRSKPGTKKVEKKIATAKNLRVSGKYGTSFIFLLLGFLPGRATKYSLRPAD